MAKVCRHQNLHFSKLTMSKIIAVIGSTGKQGGSVVDTFLKESGWRVRALTRNPDSPAAHKLKEKGVKDIVAADLDNFSSLVKAFEGAHAVFSVTDFWTMYYDPANDELAAAAGKAKNVWIGEKEEQQGKNVFDAAAQTKGLERLIFSSLSNVTKWSKGKCTHVYHFDSKARAAEYGCATYPDLWKKTSVIQVGYYLSNFVVTPFLKPHKV
jgi:nucleoside-diphosphate-sugar epimerase